MLIEFSVPQFTYLHLDQLNKITDWAHSGHTIKFYSAL